MQPEIVALHRLKPLTQKPNTPRGTVCASVLCAMLIEACTHISGALWHQTGVAMATGAITGPGW